MDPRRLALIHGGTKERRHSVGSGYLIAPRLVLTARHVLVDGEGETWPQIGVRVGHPCGGDAVPAGAELLWDHPDGLDVALLRLDRPMPLPGTDPVSWGIPSGTAPLPYEGLGFPRASAGDVREPEHLRGMLPPLSGSGRLYVLDQGTEPADGADGGRPWAGASGAAVFCHDHLVGVVVRSAPAYGTRRLRAVPVHAFLDDADFAAHLTEHTGRTPLAKELGASLPRAAPLAARTPAERELARLLEPLLGDPLARSAYARELVAELGYPTASYEPTVADLAALLTAHPRALATLGRSLAARATTGPDRDHLTHLFARARVLGCGSLLSLGEYEELRALLHGVCDAQPALLPRAAQEALRYVVLPESLTRPQLPAAELDGVIEELEALSDSARVPDGTPSVPALLRLVEYVAAACGTGAAAALRDWSTGVAARLGVHPVAMRERRADAAAWSGRPASPVTRVVMELHGDTTDDEAGDDGGRPERFRCRILLARADGTHRVLHETDSTPKTPREAARCLSEAVAAAGEEPGQGDHVPWVTVVVDRTGLHLAVDQWEPGAANPFVPDEPLGASYRLTLSCPDLGEELPARCGDQERRWRHGRGTALVTDPRQTTTARQLMHLLRTDHRDTAQVVLHGPADQRPSWLLLCLALGVPVVLWDREATGYEDAHRLRGLAPAGGLDGLPERVRVHRGRAAAYPAEPLARPALVWEPEGRPPAPEPLQLRDPWKGTHAS